MCTIGLISPPTGMTVFVIQAQHPEIPVMRIYMGTLPFFVADFVLVALLIFMPSIALWYRAFSNSIGASLRGVSQHARPFGSRASIHL